MEKLRSEIRAAFEKEQAAHPPVTSLRQNVVAAVTAHPRRATNYQWLAVAAALVLGVLVVAGLMSTRLARHAIAPAHTQPTATAATAVDYGPPPAGVPLVYVQDPTHEGWLIGFDWAGRPRGTVKMPQRVPSACGACTRPLDTSRIGQAPDGSVFGISPSGKGGFTEFMDVQANPLPMDPSLADWPVNAGLVWADDGKHLCGVWYPQRGWSLITRLPSTGPTSVPVAIDPDGAIVRSGIIGLSVAACGLGNDRAVITRDVSGVEEHVWVVRMSDGKILAHHTYAANQLANIVASGDGALIAENSAKSSGQIAPAAPSTIVRRVSDMSAVLTLDPSIGVLGFSSDNSMALVTTSPWAAGVPTHMALIEVQTGRVLWRYAGSQELAGFLAQPNGKGFAVMLKGTADSSMHPSVSVVMVRGDGSAIAIPGSYVRL
jgi:hypothetical protein